jgi:hypothetical protein
MVIEREMGQPRGVTMATYTGPFTAQKLATRSEADEPNESMGVILSEYRPWPACLLFQMRLTANNGWERAGRQRTEK